MKLFLMRHAKSDWTTAGENDIDRSINARGKKTASFMGRFLASTGEMPQRILVSPAKRAQETYELFEKASDFRGEVETRDSLYYSHAGALQEEILKELEKTPMLMLIGHNPILEELGSLFLHSELPVIKMATGSIAVIEWEHVYARLRFLLPPKVLMRALGEL